MGFRTKILGRIYCHAKEILFACEEAVTLASDRQNKISYLDSRGLAKALTGNIQGAIEDFQTYVDYAEVSDEYKDQRKQWIEALRKGDKPFTEGVLETLNGMSALTSSC